MNFAAYLGHQNTEDCRAFIIHFPPCRGKSAFARRLAETREDLYYLDLLAYFLEHPELPRVGKFDFKALSALLLKLAVPQPAILVDNLDFLLNTWKAEEKQALLAWIQNGLRSPAMTRKTFIFLIQDEGLISAAVFHNTYHEPRVLALDLFEAV